MSHWQCVDVVNVSTLASCRRCQVVTLAMCRRCQVVYGVKLSTLASCRRWQVVDGVKLSTVSSCRRRWYHNATLTHKSHMRVYFMLTVIMSNFFKNITLIIQKYYIDNYLNIKLMILHTITNAEDHSFPKT